jgi:DNA modification methylase
LAFFLLDKVYKYTIILTIMNTQAAKEIIDRYTLAGQAGVTNDELYAYLPGFEPQIKTVGKQKDVDVAKRAIRWHQQSLKQLGLIERVPGERGKWRCKTGTNKLDDALPGKILVSFSTRLGLALYADCNSVFNVLNEPLHLCLTSPPYPLARARAYGNPTAHEFVDFITTALEPIVKHLVVGGSVTLNIGNDIFLNKSPARSLYVERTVIALHDRLGLSLMDRLIWHNPCKSPAPARYASGTRQQLNVSFEHVLWFTNSPQHCFADNRRVLVPHSKQHANLIASGGEKRQAINGDGAYHINYGSFGAQTQGTIPRNVLRFPSNEGNSNESRKFAKELADAGLPKHGAPMPLALAKFLIKFLTLEPECPENAPLVVDPFGGKATTAKAAEQLGRRWLITERAAQYSAGSALQFTEYDGFEAGFVLA